MQDAQLVTTIVKALTDSLRTWRQMARFQGIMINGPIATGPAGCLVGNRLDTVLPALLVLQGDDKTIALAVSRGAADAFDLWRQSVVVAGAPWYPTFTQHPGPMAPPTPNAPWKLNQLAQDPTQLNVPMRLEQTMIASASKALHGKTPDTRTAGIIKQVAPKLAQEFNLFLTTSTVINVLGQGPIPSFQPPSNMVGQVVNGSILPMTGMLT